RLQYPWWSGLVAAGLMGLVGATEVRAAGEQFLLVLGFREGRARSLGIPLANGFIDYVTLLNERDGGINRVRVVWEDCETVGDGPRAVECYERLKTKGSTGAVVPLGTLLVNALIERATHAQIPLLAVGIGRSDAADGRVFPSVFTPPTPGGARIRPRSGSSPNGPAVWTSSRAGTSPLSPSTTTIAGTPPPSPTP